MVSAKTWYKRPASGLQGGNPSSKETESQKNAKALKEASSPNPVVENQESLDSHTLTEKSASGS